MRQHHMIRRLFAFLAAAAVLLGAGLLTTTLAAGASPSLTVKGLNKGPRTGPDGGPLNECPLTVTYSGGAASGTVRVDVVSVAPTTPTGKSVLIGGPKTVTLDGAGSAAVVFSPSDFDFANFVSTPPNQDNYKIQVIVTPGPTTDTFWVADCAPTPTPGTTTTTPTTVAPTTTTKVAPTTVVNTTSTTAKAVPASVLAQVVVNPKAPTAAVVTPQLAKTGPHAGIWLISAMGLLAAGVAVTLFARLGRTVR